MKNILILASVIMVATLSGCEHVNVEFDWGMLLESVAASFKK